MMLVPTPNCLCVQEDQSTVHVLHICAPSHLKKTKALCMYSKRVPIHHPRRQKHSTCTPNMYPPPLKKTKAQSMYSTDIPIQQSRRPKHRACTPLISPLNIQEDQSIFQRCPFHHSRRPKHRACTPQTSPFTVQEDRSTEHVHHRCSFRQTRFRVCRRQDKSRRVASRHSATFITSNVQN